MNTQRPRNYALIAVAIVVAAVVIAASLFVTMGGGTTITKTVSESATQQTTTSSTGSVVCSFAAEGFLYMKVLNSSNNEPISSLPVQVVALYPACLTNPPYKQNVGTMNTNASGILSLGGPYNEYYLTINNGFRDYSVNASISAGLTTCVTVSIPPGNQNYGFAYTIMHPLNGPC
jgi:hypothetical protein